MNLLSIVLLLGAFTLNMIICQWIVVLVDLLVPYKGEREKRIINTKKDLVMYLFVPYYAVYKEFLEERLKSL